MSLGRYDTPDNEAYRDASLVHGMSTTLLPKLLVTWRMRAQPASPQSMPNRMQNADLLLIAYRTAFIVIRLAFVINLSGVCGECEHGFASAETRRLLPSRYASGDKATTGATHDAILINADHELSAIRYKSLMSVL